MARRRRNRRLFLSFCAVLLLVLSGAIVYGLWQPFVRISSVTVSPPDASLAAYATEAMRGTYAGLIPRDSTFFFPAHEIRASILAAHPELAAVSLSRRGLSGLSVIAEERTAVGRWCGLAPPAAGGCYLFDPSGFIYKALPGADASSTPEAPKTLNAFDLYAPLANGASEPLGAIVADAAQLPDAFDFARQLSDFGAAASAVVLRGDEIDILLSSGTRVTYVLGDEQDAYAALASAKSDLNLADGSLEYVDLRFPGKVYLKKKG